MKIAFYKGKTRLFNRLVCWWTSGKYSHTELVVREAKSGQSLCYSSSFLDGGIRRKWIRLDPEHWDIIEIDADAEYAYSWFEKRIGCGYDVMGILGFILRRGEYNKTKYFCSEAVAGSIGISEGWRFDPNSFKVLVDSLKIYKKENENG